MADKISRERRSQNMARIGPKNSRSEMTIRRLLHAMGYRFQLHVTHLPGKPDVVFSNRKKVIFVHGCFWHQHQNCRNGGRPKSNQEFWNKKLSENVKRDIKNYRELEEKGWSVLVVWECEVADKEALIHRLTHFIGPTRVRVRDARGPSGR